MKQKPSKKRIRPEGYYAYTSMIYRCYRKEDNQYCDYGGRGIEVCDRWRGKDGFKNFISDMGVRPKGMSLDRYPNKDGNYEPGNVRWATPKEQARNTRGNRYYEYKGIRKLQTDWADFFGVKSQHIIMMMKGGKRNTFDKVCEYYLQKKSLTL